MQTPISPPLPAAVPFVDLLQVVGLIGSLATIILGVIAIWLSLYFYRRSNEIFAAIFKALLDITASTKTTEATTTQVTSRVLDGLLSRVTRTEEAATLKVSQALGQAMPSATKEQLGSVQRELQKKLTEAFSNLKSSVAPTSSTYDWGPFIRRIADLERKNRFLSVKWLHQTIFADDPGNRTALQVAIDENKVLITYKLENPKKPGSQPTLCCKLNKADPAVASALADSINPIQA